MSSQPSVSAADRALAGALLLAASSTAAEAGVVSNLSTFDFGYRTYYVSPFTGAPGQTFTAIDSQILSIGFGFANARGDEPPSDPLTFTLYQGEGFGGPVLAQQQAIPTSYSFFGYGYGLFEFAFPASGLVIGQTYTLGIAASSEQLYLSYGGNDPGFENALYDGGAALLAGTLDSFYDLDFIVTGTTPAVDIPAPAALALFSTALAGLGLARFASRRPR